MSLQPCFEDIASFDSLRRSARQAARGKMLSREAMAFVFDLELEVLQLERELCAGSYTPRDYRTFSITEPKPRAISAAAFRDRVVHHALCRALEPLFESVYVDDSFACRKGKGNAAAVDRAQQLCRRHRFYLKLDIRKFFETMDHQVLKERIEEIVEDRRVCGLAGTFVEKGAPGSPEGKGQPIGNLTSQHFANFYLTWADWYVTETLAVPGYCRYMDDMVLFGDSKECLWTMKDEFEAFLRETLRLQLRPKVTTLAPCTEGLPFLGFRIWPGLIRLDGHRVRRFRRKMRRVSKRVEEGNIEMERARSIVQSLLGWVEQADARQLCVSMFAKRFAESSAS